MATRVTSTTQKPASPTTNRWLQIGIQAALGSILAVLLVQTAILALWPNLAAFKPLDSYARSALFTFIPALGATAVYAWLVKTQNQPVKKFLCLSTGILMLSFIPDYLLPVPYRTLLASSAAAFLHLIAGIVTVTLVLFGFKGSTGLKK